MKGWRGARKPVEEKARVEKRLKLVRPLLVVFGLVFVISVFVAQRSSPEKQAPDAQDAKVFYEICKEKLKQAKELDVLSDLNAKGSSIEVTVGPAFFTVPADIQQEFARAAKGVSFDLMHWQTGKKVASWNGERLDVD
jgi:hypothetical protein